MIKQTLVCCLALSIASPINSLQLSNPLLKVADQAGLFNRAIIDILKVRQKIKEFVTGKLIWKGAQCDLSVVDQQGQPIGKQLHLLIKRPETLFGATFVIINPNHPEAAQYFTPASQQQVAQYITATTSKNMLSRIGNATTDGVQTGLYIINPMTQELMPIFIADYTLENYDTRMTHAHVAVPGHDHKDFGFAQAHTLPIKMVVDSTDQGKSSCPQINKTTNELISAYQGEYDDCIIINSDFLNGTLHESYEKALAYLSTNFGATEYKKAMIYQLSHKQYSIHDLSMIELTIAKEKKELSSAQKELLSIIMVQAQADFLGFVEHFLVNAKDTKELMIEMIEESCQLRETQDSYLLKWAHMNSNETEKAIFQRDINSFTGLYKFCSELVEFLGDFAYSCPNALEGIKNLKH